MQLFFAHGCPFAHRTRALLAHLRQPYQPREVDLSAKPADFLALSPTGRVPLLEDEGFVLYESAIINGYLAERLACADAFSPDVRQRARERLAMAQFDAVLVPHLFAELKRPGLTLPTTVQREVESLAATAAAAHPASLLAFHVATHWLRWTVAAADTHLVPRLRQEAGLARFLDDAAALPAVQSTAPSTEETVQAFRRFRATG
jgi:glutathione S-transferase